MFNKLKAKISERLTARYDAPIGTGIRCEFRQHFYREDEIRMECNHPDARLGKCDYDDGEHLDWDYEIPFAEPISDSHLGWLIF